jgi:hypothetical protein
MLSHEKVDSNGLLAILTKVYYKMGCWNRLKCLLMRRWTQWAVYCHGNRQSESVTSTRVKAKWNEKRSDMKQNQWNVDMKSDTGMGK